MLIKFLQLIFILDITRKEYYAQITKIMATIDKIALTSGQNKGNIASLEKELDYVKTHTVKRCK